MTAAQLHDVCFRMKIVGFNEAPAKFARQQLTDRCFAGAGNTENNYNHNTLFCLRLPIFSITNAMMTKSV